MMASTTVAAATIAAARQRRWIAARISTKNSLACWSDCETGRATSVSLNSSGIETPRLATRFMTAMIPLRSRVDVADVACPEICSWLEVTLRDADRVARQDHRRRRQRNFLFRDITRM